MSCCPTTVKPVTSAYVGSGIGGYIVGAIGSTTKGVVLVPDIFGNHPNAYHLADVIAANGFIVVLPDVFPNNTAWPTTKMPMDRESPEAQEFFARIQRYEHYIGEISKAAALLRSLGCTTVGSVGLCWGAKPAIGALKAGVVNAYCGVHPSRITIEDVVGAPGPVGFLMSKGEPPSEDIKQELETNQFAAKNLFVRYDDLYHGFLGARGPLEKAFEAVTDDAVAARVAEASATLVSFLQQTL